MADMADMADMGVYEGLHKKKKKKEKKNKKKKIPRATWRAELSPSKPPLSLPLSLSLPSLSSLPSLFSLSLPLFSFPSLSFRLSRESPVLSAFGIAV